MANVVLLQFANKQIWTQFITDSAGIWYVDFEGTYTGIDSTIASELETALYPSVITVNAAGTELTKVLSWTDTIAGRAAALAAEPSFIFQDNGNILYIRLPDYNPPDSFTVRIGVTTQLSNVAYDDKGNKLLYRSDLLGVPDLSEEKDPLFFQQFSFPEFTQTIANAALVYDDLKDAAIFGQTGNYYLGDENDSFSEFTQVKSGKIRKHQYSGDEFRLTFRDSRDSLSRSLPPNTLEQTTYTDLKDKYIGRPKPLVYGEVNQHVCIPLDDNAVQTNYTFLIADTEFYSIKSSGYTVIMDDVDKTGQVLNFSAVNGTFQLPAAHYTIDKKITFTGGGYVDGSSVLIDNPLDVVQDLMSNYLDIAYNANNFNTTEWDAETLLASDIGIAITKKDKVINVISDIATGVGSGFLLERNGLYTWRSFNADGLPVLTVYQHQWKRDPIVDNDPEETLTSATALFNKALGSNEWASVEDASKESEVFGITGEYRNREFETLYPSESDALASAQSIMVRSDDVAVYVTAVLDIRFVDLSIVKIGKNAQIEVNRLINGSYTEWYGKMSMEILKVEPDLNQDEATFEFRKISDLDEFVLPAGRITRDDDPRITRDGNRRITRAG